MARRMRSYRPSRQLSKILSKRRDACCPRKHRHPPHRRSPHDTVWGIGLIASDPRAASPTSWCGLNLLGQALERTRDTLRQNTPGGTQPYILAPRDDDTDDTVFEVDPITHVHLDRSPLNTATIRHSSRRIPIRFPMTMPLRYDWLMPSARPRLYCLNKAPTWSAAS